MPLPDHTDKRIEAGQQIASLGPKPIVRLAALVSPTLATQDWQPLAGGQFDQVLEFGTAEDVLAFLEALGPLAKDWWRRRLAQEF